MPPINAIKRQAIIDALTSAIGAILKVDGFHTDLGVNTFEWRSNPLSQAELPGQILRDKRRTTTTELVGGSDNVQDQLLSCEVEIIFAPGSTGAASIREGIADVYAALNVDRTLGGVALDIVDLGDEMVFADEEEKVVGGAICSFAVMYRTTKMTET